MQWGPLVDLWPRMNTRFGTRPTDGCMRVRDGRNAGWRGRGTCSPDRGEPNTGIPEHVRTEIQDAALTALPSQNDRPRQLSTSLTFNTTFSVPTIPDSDRRIHFHGDPERIANGLRIASASAGHFASIPSSLSAVRFLLFTFWATHAEPLPFGRIWRTPIAQEAHTKCTPVAHSHAPSGGHVDAHLSGHARGHGFGHGEASCDAHQFRLLSELVCTPACTWVAPAERCLRAHDADSLRTATRTRDWLGSAPTCSLRNLHLCGPTSSQHFHAGVHTGV